MAVPKVKTSRVRTRRRRSHDALAVPHWVKCSNCSSPTLPHRVCLTCGQYKGRQIYTLGLDEDE